MYIPIVIITCKKYHGTDYACIQYNRLYTLKSIYSNSAYFKFNSFVNIIQHIIRIPVIYVHNEVFKVLKRLKILHSFLSRKPELYFDKFLLIYSFSFQHD